MKKCLISVLMVVLSIALVGCGDPFALGTSDRPVSVNVAKLRPQAKVILESSLEDQNAMVRTNAIEVLVTTDCKEMAPVLLKRLSDPVVSVRFAAVLAIGDMRVFGYERQIRPLLYDSNANIQIAAAYTMVKLNQPQYAESIREAAESDNQTVRANALLLLGKLGNRDDIPLLYTIMQREDSTDKVRLQAVESIARLGDSRIYRTKLWALQISIYPDDRVMGIRGMGVLGTSEAENAILTMLKDDILEVRLAAAEELGRLGNVAGEQKVYDFFRANPNLDETNLANNLAIRAIGRIPSRLLKNYLPAVLNSQSTINRLLGAQSVLLLSNR